MGSDLPAMGPAGPNPIATGTTITRVPLAMRKHASLFRLIQSQMSPDISLGLSIQ